MLTAARERVVQVRNGVSMACRFGGAVFLLALTHCTNLTSIRLTPIILSNGEGKRCCFLIASSFPPPNLFPTFCCPQFASMLADIGFISSAGSSGGKGSGSGGSRSRGGRGWVDDPAASWNRYAASPAVVSYRYVSAPHLHRARCVESTLSRHVAEDCCMLPALTAAAGLGFGAQCQARVQ